MHVLQGFEKLYGDDPYCILRHYPLPVLPPLDNVIQEAAAGADVFSNNDKVFVILQDREVIHKVLMVPHLLEARDLSLQQCVVALVALDFIFGQDFDS